MWKKCNKELSCSKICLKAMIISQAPMAVGKAPEHDLPLDHKTANYVEIQEMAKPMTVVPCKRIYIVYRLVNTSFNLFGMN